MSIIERALLKQRTSTAASSGVAGVAPVETLPVAPTNGAGATSDRLSFHETFVPSAEPLPWDDSRLERAGLLAAPEFRNRHRSQYRGVRRVLLDRIRTNARELGARSRALVVTSALAGEGKTFTSFNLATSLAQDPEYQVLLIDADLPRRTLSKALGVGGRPGFSECLLHAESVPAQFAVPLAERLSLLPAGCRFLEAGDRLATAAYPQLIATLLERHPSLILVLDAGPLLLSAESEVVTARAGAALIVVRAGATTRNAVRDAVERIPKDVPAGVLLNAWEPGVFGDPERYYGEYYDYTD